MGLTTENPSSKAILEKKPVAVGFEDGRKALLLAETAYKSIKSGRMEDID